MAPVSRVKNDDSQDWLKQISQDEIEPVVDHVKSYVAKKENEAFAFKCILVSSKLVYSDKCSSPEAFFQLTGACCNAVAPNYACDQLKLLNALYHITGYLIKNNLVHEAILISEHVIKLCRTKTNGWSKDEENTVIAFTHSFSKLLMSCDFSQDLDALCKSNNNSALSVWHHLATLASCLNRKPFGDLLCILINITQRCNNEDKGKIATFLSECLRTVLTVIEANGRTEKMKLEETVLIRILRVYRTVVLHYISCESVTVLKVSILSILDRMKRVFSCSAEQISCIQLSEKILHFAHRSMLDMGLDAKLLKECLSLTDKWKERSELFYSFFYFMNTVLLKLKVLWAKKQLKIPGSVLSLIIKLISRSNQFFGGHRVEVCSKDCKLNCDETTLLQSMALPFNLLIIYSGQNSTKNETVVKFYSSIYKDLQALFSEALDFIYKIHEAGCPKLPDLYAYILPFLSSVISSFVTSSLCEMANNLAVLTLQTFAKLPQSFLEKYFLEKYLVKFISIICYGCVNLSQFDLALRIISVWVVILPSRKQSLFKLWAEYKNDVSLYKGKQIKDTIIHTLESNSSVFKTDWNIPECSPEDLTSLLLEEVKAYCKFNLSYQEPFFAAFDARKKSKMPIDQEAAMLCFLLRFLAQDTLSIKRLAAMLDRVKEVETKLCLLKKKSTTKEKIKINILLGCLIVARARCLILKIRNQNEVEFVTHSMAIEQPKDHERGTEINPNDFCNVTPALSYLKVDKQDKLFEILDEGMKYLSTASSSKNLESISVDSCLLIDSIIDAAYIYKLYGHEAMENFAWELLFKVSCTLKDDEASITAMINILELNVNVNSKWMAHAHALVQSLDASKSFLKTSYTLACIRNSFLKQDYDSVRKLFQEVNEQDLKKHRVLYAEYHILLSKCFCDPSVSPTNCALEAWICVAALIKEKNWKNFVESCKLSCVIFEASSNIGQNYLELMLPRETRSFLKSQLKIAQKLALPLRLAQVLVQLTWVDIMCCNRSESQSKIQTLEEILQLNTRISKLVPIKTGSRRTKLIKIEPPDFFKHENCQCFVCSSSLCQQLIIETVRLQAAATNLHPEFRNYSRDFLKCAQNMLEKVCQKSKEEWMQLSEVKLFIQYVDHLFLIGNLKEASKISQKISEFIASFPEAHPCNKMLKQDAFEQAVSLNCGLKMAG